MPQRSLHTPLGDLTVFEDGDAIVSVDWGWVEAQDSTPLLLRAEAQLQDFLDGARRSFDLPLAPAGTPYRRKVWQALIDIPYGEVRTYGQIAAVVGGSPRSVGQANGSNPIPLIIPCHRVVAGSHLGGYSGGDGADTKRWLLALEGGAGPLL